MTRPLAVLRPEPGNAATIARIEALGLRAIRLPLFAVQAIDWAPPDPGAHDALFLTSANAIRFGGPGLDRLRHLPVLAVGQNTARAARGAGFDVMAVGEADAAALLALAAAKGINQALHLGGRERSIDPGGAIARAITVYANEALPIADRALATLAGATALLHSVRAAERLGELVDGHGPPRSAIVIASFSAKIAAAAGSGWAGSAIAAVPTDAALIAATRTLAD